MLPIVTPEEMAAIDAAAPEGSEVLIERAGGAVAWAALRMLGGSYGRTVNVICGKGNNGADGRVAAKHLAVKGVRVRVIEVPCPTTLPPADLVIDAAYGTGFHGTWSPPEIGDTPVLAVDLPSGVDALTGDIAGAVLAATRTVTFAALKPGLLMPPGSVLSGELELADIGLDVGWARANLVLGADVAGWWPERDEYSHKWRSAVRVIAGSSTMTGAPRLVSHAA
ncbi:MAG: NAD(P)H-hydrate epimerase, partial [Ilumatobacteraceae bacterium]